MSRINNFDHLIKRLKMRHFELLDHLGAQPNLVSVAAEMNIGQSTATKMLQDIEEVLGVPLFERNRRGITATKAGETVIERSRLILSDLKATHEELEIVNAGGAGYIRIGVFPVATSVLIPTLYEQLSRQFHNLVFAIEEGDEIRLITSLLAGKIDMILGRIDPVTLTKETRHYVLYHEDTVVVCGVKNPIANVPENELANEMAAQKWILPTHSTGAYQLISSFLVNSGHPPPNVAVESISPLVTAGLLTRTNLLGILPEGVGQNFIKAGLLHRLPIALPSTNYPVGAIVRRELHVSPLIASVLEQCKYVLRSLGTKTQPH